jgi:hypothetical protein
VYKKKGLLRIPQTSLFKKNILLFYSDAASSASAFATSALTSIATLARLSAVIS